MPVVIRKAAAVVQVLRSCRASTVRNLDVSVRDNPTVPLTGIWSFRFSRTDSISLLMLRANDNGARNLGGTLFDSAYSLSIGQGNAHEAFHTGLFEKCLLIAFARYQEIYASFD